MNSAPNAMMSCEEPLMLISLSSSSNRMAPSTAPQIDVTPATMTATNQSRLWKTS